jgi:hypothetical protein
MKEKDGNIKNQLGSLKKDLPFRTPGNYFETFAERLSMRIAAEEVPEKKRSLVVILKPLLAVAALLVLALLLVYEPLKKIFPAGQETVVQVISNPKVDDSTGAIPGTLISNFSEEQFLSAFTDTDNLESRTLSPENLADYIADNYSDYEILTNN